jgi:hypothetical protein
MEKTKEASPEFGVCINNDDYPASLELHKIYRVLPDEDAAADSDIRIIDESGEDYLYPASHNTLFDPPLITFLAWPLPLWICVFFHFSLF